MLVSELLTMIVEDPDLKVTLEKHGTDIEDLKLIFDSFGRLTVKLLYSGRDIKSRSGHYVPASALAFGATLDFILTNWTADDETINLALAARLVDYFDNGETGAIRIGVATIS